MNHPTIYDLIRATRERNQFTPTEVARRAGVERANYIRLEQGMYDCRWSTIVKVCKVLGIDTLSVRDGQSPKSGNLAEVSDSPLAGLDT